MVNNRPIYSQFGSYWFSIFLHKHSSTPKFRSFIILKEWFRELFYLLTEHKDKIEFKYKIPLSNGNE